VSTKPKKAHPEAMLRGLRRNEWMKLQEAFLPIKPEIRIKGLKKG
jgi:hypothetical protein